MDLTRRQKKFAVGIAKGLSTGEAGSIKGVDYSPTTACHTKNNPKVISYISKVVASLAKDGKVTKDTLLQGIGEVVEESKKPSDKLRGYELLLKAQGHLDSGNTVNLGLAFGQLPSIKELQATKATLTPSEIIIDESDNGSTQPPKPVPPKDLEQNNEVGSERSNPPVAW